MKSEPLFLIAREKDEIAGALRYRAIGGTSAEKGHHPRDDDGVGWNGGLETLLLAASVHRRPGIAAGRGVDPGWTNFGLFCARGIAGAVLLGAVIGIVTHR